MKTQLKWVVQDPVPSKVFLKSLVAAFLIQVVALTLIGWEEHWLSHPQKTEGLDESHFVEAEVFQFPEEAHLVEEKKPTSTQAAPEVAISTKVSAKPQPTSTPAAAPLEEQNQTQSGPKLAPDHGPIAIYAPPPVLPAYLHDQDLNAHVVIDFFVTALGGVTPRLVRSSGNEELDAIALEAVSKWQFRPGEKDHRAIDAKVRLRIIFEVK